MYKEIIYLTMAPMEDSSGVYKKVISQSEAFLELGYECKVLFVRDTKYAYLRDIKSNITTEIDLDDSVAFIELQKYIKECSFCYARFELLRHKYYRKIIYYCYKEKINIVSEIPTYPPYQESLARVRSLFNKKQYINALKTLIGTIFVIIDMYIISFYSNIVVMIADDKKFKLAKTLRIENGINLKTNPIQKTEFHNVINIIAVSNFSVWNGYDRAIIGLRNYISSTGLHDIKLIMVGDKSAGKDLIKLAKKLGVMDDIEFRGSLSGSNLDAAYAEAHIALGALGNHRRKVFQNSSPKAKEYASRGMLMVLSDAEGMDIEIEKASFIVKSDETPIDFSAIKTWFLNINNREEQRLKLRNYAETNFSWTNQIAKIIEFIKDK